MASILNGFYYHSFHLTATLSYSYKPTNLYTAIEVNSYLETLEIFSTYVRQCESTFLILDNSFLLREFIRIARVIFMKRKALDIRSLFSKKDQVNDGKLINK